PCSTRAVGPDCLIENKTTSRRPALPGQLVLRTEGLVTGSTLTRCPGKRAIRSPAGDIAEAQKGGSEVLHHGLSIRPGETPGQMDRCYPSSRQTPRREGSPD